MRLARLSLAAIVSLPLCLGLACRTSPTLSQDAGQDEAGADRAIDIQSFDVIQQDGRFDGALCDLPGSLQYRAESITLMGGAPPDTPNLSWLHVPPGFCVHYFGTVGNARQVRFAPQAAGKGGELFVASPTRSTTGGGPGGLDAIVVLPDDNKDGFADGTLHYLDGLPETQGMTFSSDGHFYFQDHTLVRRVAFTPGDRAAQAAPTTVIDVASVVVYQSLGHWPKVLDQADDGSIYVTNGGDQGDMYQVERPFHGGILRLSVQPDGSATATLVSKGLRNPIAIRCKPGHNHCFGLELALDYSGMHGGREKLIPIHDGDDWGFPCCAATNVPYSGIFPVPDCAQVAGETDAFIIGHTPFGLAFESGGWPSSWKANAFIAMHGDFGYWTGARVVGIPTDPSTGDPLPGSEITSTGIADFATGWDDNGMHQHGRPAALAFSPDGRLFISNDATGEIVWVAPLTEGDAGKPADTGNEP